MSDAVKCRGGRWTVKKLKSGVIPLLASPQGGVAASSIKCRAATEADAAWVVFLFSQSENHPGLASAEASRHFIDRSATPPCGDARRGIRRSETSGHFFHLTASQDNQKPSACMITASYDKKTPSACMITVSARCAWPPLRATP